MFGRKLVARAAFLLELAKKNEIKLVSAESCTGGLIASLITAVPGSSLVFERGFVVYSNLAKEENLGIPKTTLEKYGAVSFEVAKLMAKGAVANSKADLSIITTGIAGPGGASLDKPIGLVYIASCNKLNKKIICEEFRFSGNRDQIRLNAVEKATEIMISQIQILI